MMNVLRMAVAAACSLLIASGCAHTDKVQVSATGELPSVGTTLSTDYPKDGWYAYIPVFAGGESSRAEQLQAARALADFARSHGYPTATVLPDPGVLDQCWGGPCLASFRGPGGLGVVLTPESPLPGPDITTSTWDEAKNFILTVVEPGNVRLRTEAVDNGLTSEGARASGVDAPVGLPFYSYLKFSLLTEAWEVTAPLDGQEETDGPHE